LDQSYDGPITSTEQQLDHINYTLFSGAHAAAPFTCATMRRQNHFPEPNPHRLDFLSSNCTVHDHIPSTAGDTLSTIIFLIAKHGSTNKTGPSSIQPFFPLWEGIENIGPHDLDTGIKS